ncbi:exodeoxyribonuclease VII large subunit [uncultured Megasphaera sp.]|uniref:exodeoxyribonuclease VII large subunit n=1 Tax=uncultured Megasphaera sp. TaxID=165188 RepID=UPI002657D4B9|nr:exodeoxyribonuclease VII large subunit [uncultured Megasphaera sp.]
MKYASVTDVVQRIKADLQKDFRLQNIAMEGNIIGLKRASNGHYYMNICDDSCSIRAVLFRSRVIGNMMDSVRDGDHVVVIGTINVYEKGGTLSFIIERLFSQGIGSLQAEYEKIKTALEEQGYFDSRHKQSIPRFPWTVGVVTSRTGAVLHDIHKIAAERNPYVQIRLYAVPVQGEGAAEKLARTIRQAGCNTALDVLIVARGGGSMEDLWCFNSPEVVKAIYEAAVPVITAIGHETDTTLADFAADVRAATPTHAAELAFPSIDEIEMDLAAMSEQVQDALQRRMERYEREIAHLKTCIRPERYEALLGQKAERISRLRTESWHQITMALTGAAGKLERLKAALAAAGPEALRRRGYGQVLKQGQVVSRIQDISGGDLLSIQMADGQITAEVKEVHSYGKSNR